MTTKHSKIVWTEKDLALVDRMASDLIKPYNDYICDAAVDGSLPEYEVEEFIAEYGLTLNFNGRRIFSRAVNQALCS